MPMSTVTLFIEWLRLLILNHHISQRFEFGPLVRQSTIFLFAGAHAAHPGNSMCASQTGSTRNDKNSVEVLDKSMSTRWSESSIVRRLETLC